MLKLLVLILNLIKFDEHRDYKVGELNGTKFIYRFADEYDIYDYGMSVACTACYKVLKFFPLCVLIFDEDFDEFDEEEQEFIVFHELGHINLHFKTNVYEKLDTDDLSENDKLLIEHEADMYGIEHTSYKAGMNTLKKLIVMFNDEDVKKRLQMVKIKLN